MLRQSLADARVDSVRRNHEIGLAQWLAPAESLLERAQEIAEGWIAEGRPRTFRGGFSLDELASRVREVAIAGTDSPGWLLMMRAHDEVQAQEVADLFGGCPLLAMVPEGAPVEVGGSSHRARVPLPGLHNAMNAAAAIAAALALEVDAEEAMASLESVTLPGSW